MPKKIKGISETEKANTVQDKYQCLLFPPLVHCWTVKRTYTGGEEGVAVEEGLFGEKGKIKLF